MGGLIFSAINVSPQSPMMESSNFRADWVQIDFKCQNQKERWGRKVKKSPALKPGESGGKVLLAPEEKCISATLTS